MGPDNTSRLIDFFEKESWPLYPDPYAFTSSGYKNFTERFGTPDNDYNGFMLFGSGHMYTLGGWWGKSPPDCVVCHLVGVRGAKIMRIYWLKAMGWFHWRVRIAAVAIACKQLR